MGKWRLVRYYTGSLGICVQRSVAKGSPEGDWGAYKLFILARHRESGWAAAIDLEEVREKEVDAQRFGGMSRVRCGEMSCVGNIPLGSAQASTLEASACEANNRS